MMTKVILEPARVVKLDGRSDALYFVRATRKTRTQLISYGNAL